MPVTKKAIADYLGISRTAVSLALNNSKNSTLSEETRQRILRTAKELGYKNVSTVRKICCVLFNTVHREHFNMTYLNKIEELLGQNGYHLVYTQVTDKADSFTRLRELLDNGEADGVILTGDMDPEVVDFIESAEIPYVIFSVPEAITKNVVSPDSEMAAVQVVRYLLERGHERIALFLAELESYIQRQSLVGYRRALEEAGVPFDPALVQVSSRGDGYELAARMHTLGIPYTAAFCANNDIQFKALQWLKDNGVAVPEQVSLVGYGHTELHRLSSPGLTVFAFDIDRSARIIVDTLLTIIDTGEDRPEKRFLTDLRLYEGGTVADIRK